MMLQDPRTGIFRFLAISIFKFVGQSVKKPWSPLVHRLILQHKDAVVERTGMFEPEFL
jgi:hypothetical protein